MRKCDTGSGTVDSWLEYGTAQDNAYQAGAKSVTNDLTVRESSSG